MSETFAENNWSGESSARFRAVAACIHAEGRGDVRALRSPRITFVPWLGVLLTFGRLAVAP